MSDGANHQLVVLDRQTGAELQRIGKEGRDPGEFHFPVSVAIGPSGDVYVSDTLNNRVQQLHPDGEYVMSFGSMGTGFGQFTRPKGIAVDRAGRLYASDSAFENVQIMDAEGGLLLFFGGPGVQPGAMNMPASIAISYDAVATFSDRVASGHSIDYVVFVASGADPYKVNVYGFLKTD